MTASADLYATAARAERAAMFTEHMAWREPGEERRRPDQESHHGCFRCHLEAKARLFVRAGDAAKALEDRA